ncbi:N-acetylmuramoyl-L-alanine amidase [Sneathiella sp. P13V-1]|nr:N-acetylmuramoyl-L-alanine amidase [Sneathiella sp. P13V-1]
MVTAEAALRRLCDPRAEVSAHYLVMEDGEVHQLVSEDKRAWHAGVGVWRGITDLNSASIGVEIVNPGHEFGYVDFAEEQMKSVALLAEEIVRRHDIKPWNVIGHSDLAPERKEDPGEKFNWKLLASMGIGMWPTKKLGEARGEAQLIEDLKQIGYDCSNLQKTILAFQRHWRPNILSGLPDEETQRIARTLCLQLSS